MVIFHCYVSSPEGRSCIISRTMPEKVWNGVIRENSLLLSSGFFHVWNALPGTTFWVVLLLTFKSFKGAHWNSRMPGCLSTFMFQILLRHPNLFECMLVLVKLWCPKNPTDSKEFQELEYVGIQGILRVKAQCFKKTSEKAVIPLLIVAWIMLVVVPLSFFLLYQLYWVKIYRPWSSIIYHKP